MKAVLRREKARNRADHKLASLTYIQRAEARPKAMPAPPPPPRAAKPAPTRMRHAPAGAPRRELSKSVEFLKIGSLQQMLWP